MENIKRIHKDIVVMRNNDGELVVTSRQVAEDFKSSYRKSHQRKFAFEKHDDGK